ncbi:ferredoxin [Streptomyces sp. 900105755]|uniref:Ferredoxin n=1 Tax=Streptomyces sp. 900105755 TaxID=3154389 RepID=A0ABV1TUX2_9ACTN|nr:ferredoxin [Streptomyces barringtoniae]MCC5476405.1 ferredoxin [Streptomyces barringtoniae]
MSGTHSLGIDRIACDGYGLCAELLPELVELDEWGYPIVGSAPLTGQALGHARRAVAACPALALRLDRAQHRAPDRQSPQRT